MMVPSAGLAISAILRNKMRSALTMLGIIIGVGAVVMMQSMRGGATAYVSELISGLGSNMPIAFPGTPRGFGHMTTGVPLFTLNDLGACRNPNPNENRTMNKTDNQLKQDIESELRWDPKVNSAQIGVSVDKGAVTLLGAVDTYAQKWAAEDATKRVFGVLTVAQDLTVKILADHKQAIRTSLAPARAPSRGTSLRRTPSPRKCRTARSRSRVRSGGISNVTLRNGRCAIGRASSQSTARSRSSPRRPRHGSRRRPSLPFSVRQRRTRTRSTSTPQAARSHGLEAPPRGSRSRTPRTPHGRLLG